MRIRAAALLTALFLTAGCGDYFGPHNVVTQTDRRRLGVLQADPVLKLAVSPLRAHSGIRIADTQWNRGLVDADLMKEPTGTLEAARSRIVQALGVMRQEGWQVLYSECQPPGPPGTPEPAMTPDSGWNPPYQWTWTLYLYRLAGGVSYWADLHGGRRPEGAWAAIELIAPQEHDRADLFPDRPPGLTSRQICVERAGGPHRLERAGVPLTIRQGMRYDGRGSPPLHLSDQHR